MTIFVPKITHIYLDLLTVVYKILFSGHCVLTAFSVSMTLLSSWSSSPRTVTVKSTMEVLAEISGVKTGLGNLVVMYSMKPSRTFTSLSPTFTLTTITGYNNRAVPFLCLFPHYGEEAAQVLLVRRSTINYCYASAS